MVEHSFQVIIEKDEDGVFVASVPSLPGCHTQGTTFEEVRKRAKQAVSLYLGAKLDDFSKVKV